MLVNSPGKVGPRGKSYSLLSGYICSGLSTCEWPALPGMQFLASRFDYGLVTTKTCSACALKTTLLLAHFRAEVTARQGYTCRSTKHLIDSFSEHYELTGRSMKKVDTQWVLQVASSGALLPPKVRSNTTRHCNRFFSWLVIFYIVYIYTVTTTGLQFCEWMHTHTYRCIYTYKYPSTLVRKLCVCVC